MNRAPVLEVHGLSKTFPEKKRPACKDISFSLYRGEVTALVGENGAGKSTLVNMITGEIFPDTGTISLEGVPLAKKRRPGGKQSKIGQVHQHPVLARELNFFTNIIAGKNPPPKIIRNRRECEKLNLLAKHYNLDIPLFLKSGKGTLLQQQNAELLSILQNNPKIIIIDEPAALLEKEWEQSFLKLLSHLQKEGLAILLISHKISKLLPFCQNIITLRNGEQQETTEQYLSMSSDYSWINQLPQKTGEKTLPHPLNPTIECRKISISDNHLLKFNNITFSLFPGEIVAIEGSREAGLNLIENFFTGMIRFKTGELIIKGATIPKYRWSPSCFRKNGGSAVPAQRITEGCIPSASVSDNQIFSKESPKTSSLFKFSLFDSFLSRKKRNQKVEAKRKIFPFEGEAFQPLSQLSGGNIQRIILARELDPMPDILVISEPSRGLDTAGRKELFSQLIQLRNNGCAILLLSADFSETEILADRIFRIRDNTLKKRISKIT